MADERNDSSGKRGAPRNGREHSRKTIAGRARQRQLQRERAETLRQGLAKAVSTDGLRSVLSKPVLPEMKAPSLQDVRRRIGRINLGKVRSIADPSAEKNHTGEDSRATRQRRQPAP
jgi:hypothetical protein